MLYYIFYLLTIYLYYLYTYIIYVLVLLYIILRQEEQLKRQDEALELRAMRAEMKHGTINKPNSHIDSDKISSSSSSSSSSDSINMMMGNTSSNIINNRNNDYYMQQQLQNIPRPKKVVKKTIRRILEDGSEIIEVAYLLSSDEVDRVRREADRKSHEEELYSRSAGLMLKNVKSGSVLDTDETTLSKALPSSLKIKLKVSSTGKSTTGGGGRRGSNASATSNADNMDADDNNNYKPRTGSTARQGAHSHIQYRMPHVHFAMKLEIEFMKIWRKKNSM